MPVYNEQGCIEKVVTDWHAALSKLNLSFGMLIINDGSKDQTGEILDRVAEGFENIQIIHQENSGHGPALRNGYLRAIEMNPEWVFQVDSDDQFLTSDFVNLWQKRQESQFILGNRAKRDDPLHRLIITRIMRLVVLLIFGVKPADLNIPYRLIKTDLLAKLIQYTYKDTFAPNIVLSVAAIRGGENSLDIPVHHKERETGEVSIVRLSLIKACFKTLFQLIRFRCEL